jgi:hypothetical protein
MTKSDEPDRRKMQDMFCDELQVESTRLPFRLFKAFLPGWKLSFYSCIRNALFWPAGNLAMSSLSAFPSVCEAVPPPSRFQRPICASSRNDLKPIVDLLL